MRLKFFGEKVLPSHSRTRVRDAARDPAGNVLTEDAAPIAAFPKGHKATAHADGLRVFDAAGVHIATFHTPHTAQNDAAGVLRVFPKASRATKDAPLGTRLAEINRQHDAFYRRQP